MKRFLSALVLIFLLSGCGSQDGIEPGMTFRQRLLNSENCTFKTTVTAQYGEAIHRFAMECTFASGGALSFVVLEPETIAGISGSVSADGGQLNFDDKMLAFPVLADGLISPVSAPWLLMRTLCSGYIRAGGTDGDLYKLLMDDSFADNPLRLEVWLDQGNLPVCADIIWEGKRYLSLSVTDLSIR